ncbi:MAG: M16 family metallopeptidase, partial [Planctomycetota bacterium]
KGDTLIRLKNTARAYLLLSMPAPSIQDDLRYAAGILMHIFGGGDGSRLHWALVEEGLAEEASASYDGHDGTGDHTLFAVCDPAKADDIEGVLRAELAKLLQSITDDDLLRARSRIATGAAVGSERPNGRMFRLGTLWGYGAEYCTLEDEVERISRVTLADLRACCERFPLEPKVSVHVLPAPGAAK